MVEYQLCGFTLTCWSKWLSEFQALVAGLLAIVAGTVAFVGAMLQARAAKRQADAMMEVAEKERIERRRSAAAAFYAELTSCAVKLIADRRNLLASVEVGES